MGGATMRATMRATRGLVARGLLAMGLVAPQALGCVANIPDDRFACASTSDCPPDFVCTAGFCRRALDLDAGQPTHDAGAGDAYEMDALERDALWIDALHVDAPSDVGADPFAVDAFVLDARASDAPSHDAFSVDAHPGDANVDAFCVRRTCAAAAAECGLLDDLCGGMRNCGSCLDPGQSCVDNRCVP